MSLNRPWSRAMAWLHKRQLLASLIVAALVASPGYWQIQHQTSQQNRARCRSGNELRAAIVQLGRSNEKYIDDLLSAFGATGAIDVSKLTAAQRAQLIVYSQKIATSRAAYDSRLTAVAFKAKPC